MSGRRVTLNIERLVLRGVDPADQRAVAAGLKAELAKVLGDGDGLGASRRTPILRVGGPGPDASGRSLGAGVARAIGKGLKP
jgi:hypothetical protein